MSNHSETVLMPIPRYKDEKGPSCTLGEPMMHTSDLVICTFGRVGTRWEGFECTKSANLESDEEDWPSNRPGPSCPVHALTGGESTL